MNSRSRFEWGSRRPTRMPLRPRPAVWVMVLGATLMLVAMLACASAGQSGQERATPKHHGMTEAFSNPANESRGGETGTRSNQRPKETETRFALVGLPCSSAGRTLESWVRTHPSVRRTRFDGQGVTLAVVHDSRELPPEALRRLIESRGLHAIRGRARGTIRPPVVFPFGLDVASLPDVGEDEIEDHLVSGKVTVFHFRAPSGEICSDLDLALVVLMQSREDIALRRLASTGAPMVVVYAATAHRKGPFFEDDVEAIEEAILEAAGGDSVRIEH